MNVRKELVQGLRDGFPIGLGYAPVAFTFGFIAVSGGLPLWAAALISLTNLTSAGQFAGTNLILQGAGYIEVAMTTFVINIRYMLMSLSLAPGPTGSSPPCPFTAYVRSGGWRMRHCTGPRRLVI